ncbi:proline-rich receptor-like protein kinase PERK2 [Momordica charantia]|uniref:Proline-rich receptor-like protein kinase PERK2 n=1 Tax=Momordica charantia TaxID=3673 RepID=A0A6J1D7J7_MOMCH|nr:proline-rich receptor-like protein kinase PERK2 [Momordica charantia]
MASSKFLIIALFMVALALSSVDAARAARHLLQTAPPSLPNFPVVPMGLPPMPIPTLPNPTTGPSIIPSLPNLPQPTLPRVTLPPLPSFPVNIPSGATLPSLPSIPFLAPPPATSSP